MVLFSFVHRSFIEWCLPHCVMVLFLVLVALGTHKKGFASSAHFQQDTHTTAPFKEHLLTFLLQNATLSESSHPQCGSLSSEAMQQQQQIAGSTRRVQCRRTRILSYSDLLYMDDHSNPGPTSARNEYWFKDGVGPKRKSSSVFVQYHDTTPKSAWFIFLPVLVGMDAWWNHVGSGRRRRRR